MSTIFSGIEIRGGPQRRIQTGGGGGIRTHEGPKAPAGFQDRCVQPGSATPPRINSARCRHREAGASITDYSTRRRPPLPASSLSPGMAATAAVPFAAATGHRHGTKKPAGWAPAGDAPDVRVASGDSRSAVPLIDGNDPAMMMVVAIEPAKQRRRPERIPDARQPGV